MIENFEQVLEKLNDLNDEGRYTEVLAEADTLLKEDEQNSNLYVVKGSAQYGLGLYEDALKSYEKAISLDLADVSARANYGSTLYALGRYVEAINACDASIFLDENFVQAYINAALSAGALGQLKISVYYLEEIKKKNPNDSALFEYVGAIYADLQIYELARDTLMQAARMKDPSATVHQTIADFFRNARDAGMDRTVIVKDVNAWRNEFVRHPDVFRLAAPLVG